MREGRKNVRMKNRELIKPKKQKAWGWPAAVNFILGGLAAGFYILCFFDQLLQKDMFAVSMPPICKVLAPVLLGAGFLALIFEAGRPLRALYLLRNLRNSWMSVEALAGIIFILSAIFSWLLPYLVFPAIATVSAGVFIVSQGLILYKARAVTAWNVSFIPVLFLTSGFAMGSGLMLLLSAVSGLPYGNSLLSIALVCVAADLIVWFFYVHRSDDAAFLRVTKMLRHPLVFIFIEGIGHVLPILLLLAGMLGIFGKSGFQDVFAPLAGLFILTAGVIQKVSVVMGANYLRGISVGQPQGFSPGVAQPARNPSDLQHLVNRCDSISGDFKNGSSGNCVDVKNSSPLRGEGRRG